MSLTLLFGGAAALWWRRLPHEPAYAGRTLREWLDAAAYQDTAWWPGQEATDRAVRNMGTNAVPFLLERIQHHQDPRSALKEKVVAWLCRLNLRSRAIRYYDPYGQERWATAIQGFHALQPCAKEVAPMLAAISKRSSDPRRFEALLALGWLRAEEAIPFLLEELANTNARVRLGAFLGLQEIHPDAEAMIPILIKGLQDADPDVRRLAAQALRNFGPEARQAVPALSSLVEQEKEALRRSPTSQEHGTVTEEAEAALDAITQRRIIFDSRWRPPQNPYGQRPPPLATEQQPGQPRTNSPP